MVDKQQTVLITGGTGKIGAQLVEYFLSNGNVVVFTGRSKSTVMHLYKSLKERVSSKRLYGFAVDFCSAMGVQSLVNKLDEKKLDINSVVHAARSIENLKLSKGGFVPRKFWQKEFQMDVVVPYELLIGLAAVKKNNLKSFVNISSMYGLVAANPTLYGNPLMESPIHYNVAKAAQIHLTRELAVRFSKFGIRVNSIAFGGVEGRAGEEFKKLYGKMCPIGRMLFDSELSGPVDFLVSDKSNGMTGHVLVVDGGWTIW